MHGNIIDIDVKTLLLTPLTPMSKPLTSLSQLIQTQPRRPKLTRQNMFQSLPRTMITFATDCRIELCQGAAAAGRRLGVCSRQPALHPACNAIAQPQRAAPVGRSMSQRWRRSLNHESCSRPSSSVAGAGLATVAGKRRPSATCRPMAAAHQQHRRAMQPLAADRRHCHPGPPWARPRPSRPLSTPGRVWSSLVFAGRSCFGPSGHKFTGWVKVVQ